MIAELLSGPAGPVVIFLLRIADVSMATTRTLLVVRGARWLPPLIGFFEVLIWIFAVGSAIQNLSSPLHVLGYAGGFATGNAVGLWVEERLALGFATVRTILPHGAREVAGRLRDAGFHVTEFPGWGRDGRVRLVYSVVRRREVAGVLKAVDSVAPGAFVVVDEPRRIRQGSLFQHRRK